MMNSVKKNDDHHFSSFAMGATIGVVVALLFGTKEGRKIVREAYDSLPDKYKKVPEKLLPREEPEIARTPLITPQETPHHTTYEINNTKFFDTPTSFDEAPPPPPPLVHPTRPQNIP